MSQVVVLIHKSKFTPAVTRLHPRNLTPRNLFTIQVDELNRD